MFSSFDVADNYCQIDEATVSSTGCVGGKSLTTLSCILPPPTAFANTENEKIPALKRNDRPPIPAKPQFMANVNMNNNNKTQVATGTLNGTTKLKNLMLLREPVRKPVMRLFSSDDDSCDSLSDSEDSSDEKEVTPQKEDTISVSGTSTISSISTSSLDQISEEEKGLYVVAKITIPEQKLSKCMQLKITETVWTAKQRIIQSLAKKLPDPLNYGLYHEKMGFFLLDHKPMSEYIETGSVGSLQMRYKCRKIDEHSRNSKEGRQYTKMQSASKRRDFLLHVQQYTTDKIYSLIRKGIDPNFQCPNTGETPLTILCSGQSRAECVSVFMALLGGGAHLDFRNKRGFTPMHVAARNGNIQMLKTLLEFHASTNVVDSRDLTPLYHCILLGSDPTAARILIEHDSTVGCSDSQGWSEIHQACRHGRLQLLELLLACHKVDQDMINARNASGNTPLHVCALYNQEACAVTLLKHGADASAHNFTNQDAVQVAHVASNVNVANLINDFIENGNIIDHHAVRGRSESTTSALPPSTDQSSRHYSKKANGRSTWTPGSLVKHSKQYILQKQQSVSGSLGRSKNSPPIPISESYIATSGDIENRFDSKLPPNAKMPDVKYPKSVGNGVVDENKVRIVVRNYDAKNSEELTLRVGTRVIVLNARSAPIGYHDGMADNQRGFFPKDCVEEVKLRRPLPDTGQQQRSTSDNINDRHSTGKFKGSTKKQYSSSDAAVAQRSMMPDTVSLVSFESSEELPIATPQSPGRNSSGRTEDLANLQATSTPGIFHHTRNVALWKGDDGFGFILRGAKSEGPVHEFKPGGRIPALQYLEAIEDGSNSHNAGLRSGDFIIQIGEWDVRKYGHQQLVDTIRACGEPLHMQVTTVIHHTPTDASSVSSDSSDRKTKKGHGKTDSISSALDQLDNVLAMEDMNGTEHTASLRRMPGRKVGGEQLQNLFSRQNGTSDNMAEHSTFSSAKKPLHVPTPTLANSFQPHSIDNRSYEDTRSLRSMSSSSSSSSTFTTWGRSTGSAHAPPPATAKDFRPYSVSGATGERMLGRGGKKPPPPPPKRIDSRLTMTIPEDEPVQNSPTFSSQRQSFTSTSSRGTQQTATNASQFGQHDMAAAIALAARNRAQRMSSSSSSTDGERKPELTKEIKGTESPKVEEAAPKSVAEMSSALSIALAAKQRILNQSNAGKTSPLTQKKQGNTFIVNPSAKTFQKINPPAPFGKINVQNIDDRHILPPPPSNILPPPPPPEDIDDVSNLALPPPPSFPPPDPNHHTRFNHMTFDELLELPPPPSDLLPSPTQNGPINPPEGFRRIDAKPKPNTLTFLPPPPIPPPADDDDGCTSPNCGDNLSNADSGVADVAGDGLNLSHHHRNTLSDHSHDHVSGDNHSTVSSLSTTSTMSSEDNDASSYSHSTERTWPLREVRTNSHEAPKSSPPAAGNMYLGVLKKAKNKQATPAEQKKNSLPAGITVTKMTFAPITALPPPAEETNKKAPATTNVFPPAPKEYTETKPLFGRAPSATQTQKVEFTPKPVTASIAKPTEKFVINSTPHIATKAPASPLKSVNNNPHLATKAPASPLKSVNNNPHLATKAPSSPSKSVNNNPSPEKNTTKKAIAEWTVSDVSNWLKELGLQMYVPSFEENEITGEHLPDLGKDELIELGVKPFGHRLTIDRSVKKLVGS